MLARTINWPITTLSILLLSISILVIFSSSKELAIGQGIFAILGLIGFFFFSQFDYRALTQLIKPFYIVILLLLILVFIIGFETRGSLRWIPLGFFNIQPSEFAKPVLVLFLARFWSNNLPSWTSIFKSFLFITPLIILIFKQPDLGTTMTILAIWASLLFAAKISIKKILVLIVSAMIILPALLFTLQSYQRERITSFLYPSKDPLGAGFNLIQSTIAVGSGEILGRGLGRGTQSRLQFLPEYRTDFIFAAMAEEFGFIGSIGIIIIYLALISYCILVARSAVDYFGFLIATGVATMLLFQTGVNIGMNLGLLPITGITLPLLSYGGSSLIATLISLGLVASVAKFKPKL